eukprot:9223114-Pyramimonas_sp.AAC.1
MTAQNEEFHRQAFKRVKGHATPTDVIEGVLSDFELTGNSTADALAKQGAVYNMPDDEHVDFVRGCRKLRNMLLQYLGSFQAWLCD